MTTICRLHSTLRFIRRLFVDYHRAALVCPFLQMTYPEPIRICMESSNQPRQVKMEPELRSSDPNPVPHTDSLPSSSLNI